MLKSAKCIIFFRFSALSDVGIVAYLMPAAQAGHLIHIYFIIWLMCREVYK
jgi:hypothetical protein